MTGLPNVDSVRSFTWKLEEGDFVSIAVVTEMVNIVKNAKRITSFPQPRMFMDVNHVYPVTVIQMVINLEWHSYW